MKPVAKPAPRGEHRRQVRNLLATVRAITQPTAGTHYTVEEYVAHLHGRIDCIARVQEVLMRDTDRTVDLAELFSDELLSQGIPDSRLASAPMSWLVGRDVVEPLALALHELTTNSLKFGALGDPNGKLAVHWDMSVADNHWIDLKWQEVSSHITAIDQPTAGFGFELIHQRLTYELGARTRIDLQTGRLDCEISFPAHRSAL